MRACLPRSSSNCTRSASLIISGLVPAIVTMTTTFFSICILTDYYVSSLYFYGIESCCICHAFSGDCCLTNPCVVLVLAHDLIVNARTKLTNQYCENGRNRGIWAA